MTTLIVPIVALIRPFSSVDAALGDEKVAYFKFDEGSGSLIYDQTNYNNDGTINGATWVGGLFGNGLDFDGSYDYVDIADSASLDLGSKLTLESWIYPKAFHGDGSKGGNVILSKWDSAPTGQYVMNAYTGGNIQFRISDGTTTEKIDTTSSLSTNKWQYVVGTWDGTTMYVYVDGKEVSRKSTSITSLYNSDYTYDTLRIGHVSSSTLNNWHFNGIIDEISIYNYSLSAQTIRDTFYKTLPRTIPNSTIAHWNLNDGSGGNANDLTPNGNDGVLTEAQWTRGIEDSGLIFDGTNDYVLVSDSSSLDVRFGITLEAWVLARSFSGDGNAGGNAIISKWETSTKGQYHLSAYSNGGLAFRISEGTQWDILKVDSVLVPRSWHHIVATWNYDRMDLYVDGVRIVGKGTNVRELYQSEYDSGDYLEIGRDTNSLSQSWNFQGIIDEIIIRNHALTQSEVSGQYRRFVPWTLDDVTVGHWGFDSVEGNLAIDDIGKNNGTVANARWERGLVGNSLRFDGISDIVTILDSRDLTFLWGLTIEAWINADSFYGNGIQSGNPILTKWVSSPVGEFFLSAFEGGNVIFAISDGFIRDRMVVPANMEPGKWHHIVATWDGRVMSVYVDGAVKGWQLTNIPYFYQEEYSDDDVKIGYLTPYWTFDGVIDEVYLRNYALGASQISDTYKELAPLNLPTNISLNIYEDNYGIDDPQLNNDGATYLGDTVTFGIKTGDFVESTGLLGATDLLSAYVKILDPEGDIVIPMNLTQSKDEWVAEYTPSSAGSWEVTARVYEKRYDFNLVDLSRTRSLKVFRQVRLVEGFDTNITMNEDVTCILDLANAFEGGAPSEGDFEFDNEGNKISWPSGWMVLVPSDHVYEITPPKDLSNVTIDVMVRVNDFYIMSTDFTLKIFVRPINDPPMILGSPITECEEDSPYSCIFTLSDPDQNDHHIWGLTTEASFLSMEGSNISGMPGNDDVGVHEVSIYCTDLLNCIAFMNFTLTVGNLNDRPVITSRMPEELMEDQDFRFQFEASDIDPTNDTLSWEMETDCSFLSIDKASGVLTGRPRNEDVGEHWLRIEVDDGNGGTDEREFHFNVTNMNDIPSVLDFPEEIAIKEDTIDFTIKVSDWFDDIDGDELVFSCSYSEKIRVKLTGNGVMNLTPERDWNGRETLSITASDLMDDISIEILIVVTPIEDAPGNASISVPKQRYLKGELISLKGYADDADIGYGDRLTFGWFLDGGISIGTGEKLDIMPSKGKHTVMLNVTDSSGLWTTASVEIEVYEKTSPNGFLILGAIIFILVIIVASLIVFIVALVKRKRKGKELKSAEGRPQQELPGSTASEGSFAASMLGGARAPMQLPPIMKDGAAMVLPDASNQVKGALPPASLGPNEAFYIRPSDKGLERTEVIPQPAPVGTIPGGEAGDVGKVEISVAQNVFQAGPPIAPTAGVTTGILEPTPPKMNDDMVPSEEVFHEGDRQVWSPDMVESRVIKEAKSAVELLHELNELKNEGAITEEEFEISKNRLLRKI